MPTIPAYLRAIRPPRSGLESYKLMVEHGGLCKVGIRLDTSSARRLTSFRDKISTSVGRQYTAPVLQDSIRIIGGLPACGLTFYREVLHEEAQRFSSFDMMFTDGFLDGPRHKFPSGVSMNPTAAQDLDAVQNGLIQTLDGVTNITYVTHRLAAERGLVASYSNFRTRIPMINNVSEEQALLGHNLIRTELQKAPLLLTVIGFCLRLEVPRIKGVYNNDGLPTPVWEVFPFPQQSSGTVSEESGKEH